MRRALTIRGFGAALLAMLLVAAAVGSSAGRGASQRGEAGWRTDGTGRYPDAKPPLAWSSKQNVVWKHSFARWSNATPVLHRGRIFTCEEPASFVCLDQGSGEELWRAQLPFEEFQEPGPDRSGKKQELLARQRELQAAYNGLARRSRESSGDPGFRKELADARSALQAANIELRTLDQEMRRHGPPQTHGMNGYTSPTPVAAGDRVWALFGSGVAAAFDLEGRRLWARIVGRPTNSWGHSASPLLVDGKLIVHIDQTVHALEPETGVELWTAPSPSFWGTPFAAEVAGEWFVVTTGGVVVRCRDGKVLSGQIGRLPWTSPFVEKGVIYVVDQDGASAWKLPPRLGDEVQLEPLWKTTVARDRYYASPLLHGGLLYAMTQSSHLTVLEAATGAIVYERNLGLGGTAYPSFCLAGGKVFASAESGNTVVFEPGREYREVARNPLESFRSTPVFAGDRVYIRGTTHLWCLGAGG